MHEPTQRFELSYRTCESVPSSPTMTEWTYPHSTSTHLTERPLVRHGQLGEVELLEVDIPRPILPPSVSPRRIVSFVSTAMLSCRRWHLFA
jgi:hypothetical protein